MTTPINILLVDDEPANLLVLQTVLASLGATLVCARSGEEALKHVLLTDFAVILLDVLMPTMNGFEAARLIRSRPQSSHTPIVFITAEPDTPEFPIEEAYALGAVDYLTKPINPTVVRAKISFFTELYRKSAELARVERVQHAAALNAKEKQIRLILDNATDYAFIVTDLDGRITQWEGGAEGITGWRPEQIIGQHLEVIFTPEDKAIGRAAVELETARRVGRAQDKRWHLRKDGTRFFADGVLISLTDEAGKLHGFSKILRDGTSTWHAEQALREKETELRESRERFSLLLESSGEGICGIAADTSCTFINHAGAAMLGFRAEELIGRPIADIVHHDRLSSGPCLLVDCRISEAAQRGTAIRVDKDVFWHRDKSAIPVAYSVSPIIADGKSAGLVITYTDMTERRKTEENLRRLAADLSEVDRRKTEFLATLAHELRNPLAPIRTGVELIRLKSADTGAVTRVTGMMERQLNHLVRLVDDLLDIARIKRGKVELKKELVELKSIIASAVETSQPLIKTEGHELSIDLPDEPLIVTADPTRVAQVISNLLNNAAKYTPTGGRIRLAVHRGNQQVVVSVADSGIGLSQESLASVFEMFTQIKHDANRSQGGLGVGLSLVRRLVELHGGSVTAASAGIGQGSTFTVTLPLCNNDTSAAMSLAPLAFATQTGTGTKLCLLIADDNVDAAVGLAALLELGGHDTLIAHDGIEALRMTREFLPDAILLDIGMPGMNGYEVAQVIRQEPSLSHIALAALTGWGAEDDRNRSKEAGFDKHLTKPVAIKEVTEFLSSVGHMKVISSDK
jgi:PAS domain S-box-containing protein